MPRVRIQESSEEDEPELSPSDKIRAQSNVSDETQEGFYEDDPDEEMPNAEESASEEEVEVEVEMEEDEDVDEQDNHDASDGQRTNQINGNNRHIAYDSEGEEDSDDDDDDEDNMTLSERLAKMRAKKHEPQVNGHTKIEDELDEDDYEEEEEAPIRSFSRLSKSNRRKRKVEASGVDRIENARKKAHVSDTDDYDDEDEPLSHKLQRMSKSEPKLECKLEDDDLYDKQDDIPLAEIGRRRAKARARARAKKSSRKETVSKKGRSTKPTKTKRVKNEDEDKKGKKYEKPGQRRDTPLENDPARLFYESMYREKIRLGKKSTMAEVWMLRHGLLDDATAKKVLRGIEKSR